MDILLVFFAYLFSAWLRLQVLHGWSGNRGLSMPMIAAALIFAVLLVMSLGTVGFYDTNRRMRKLSWKLSALFLITTALFFAVTAFIFVFRILDVSRGIVLIFYLSTLILLGGKQLLLRLLFYRLRESGQSLVHQVLIGSGKLAQRYQTDVEKETELCIRIETVIPSGDLAGDLTALLTKPDFDEAVIALEPEEYIHINGILAACEKAGIKYQVIPCYYAMMPAHPVIEQVGRTRLINMSANRLELLSFGTAKRIFDILCSAFGLIILSPLLLVIAIGVRLSSPGPILFRQTRVGYNRHEFQMLKFRSMRVNDESDSRWSTAADDRRTAFGSFIRKTSLDELPQLWNVLKGEMSLVGPRPELPHFVDQFRESIPLYMVKHQVRPGITGWAQVNGYRGDTSIEKRIELDLWYIDHWSLWLDLKIIFKTVFGAMVNDEKRA